MKAFEFFSAKRQQFAQRAQAAFAQYKEAKKQRGMTLLEVIIVLGIIGTIAAGVVVLAQRAFDSRTVSEVVQNTNTIRVAIKDAYASTGVYPQYSSPLNLTNETILTADAGATTTLVKLGKVSSAEMRNKISGDFYAIGAGKTSAAQTDTTAKGYVIEVNGLTSEQCRSILSQVGNNWDYVQVAQAAAGAYSITQTALDMTVNTSNDILRTLGAGGVKNIEPTAIVNTCSNDGATNSIILGSR
ncbi:type IV pilus major pilin [Vibrio cholerae]|uniref:type IV pilus major pilin n=1 Tax=Vibrio cholerae TaxID=666 RepID=UPI000EE3E6E8|nr:type IV pilus major pilin [Vibrio cholerae]EKF9125215.1 type IV pilus major pilin [Vibrio cholerae]EKF9143583.1 type IV pilus major pilin [Vibrio cholerae]RJL29127.1 type IV pilus major pilin [Vibrio cholerae]UWY94175.1 type IV pilus major pilin [Vibrio cholerae]UWY97739.1 type IV pilus major pilin [Vibrio cholerae]